ncbi:MAG: PfkB family carbohydrate kinase [Albidovulum sp.]|nr:PfkB family carbohydrate kinase [Albidovulum sp.]MDE0533367.1 PfkB family carbohydrate kinase [Albidovulum sp.]
MLSLLGLGDNTIDIYVDRGVQYPGGNSLNFAVYAKRLGVDAHYMGCIGDDAFGAQIEDALAVENVPSPRLRRTAAQTSWSRVRHMEGDRWFDGCHLYTAEEYGINLDDEAYLGQFDLVHIGVNSMLDDKISEIARASKRLSYDFSDKYSESSLGRIAPYLEVAFLSKADGDLPAAHALAGHVAKLGPSLVAVTRGSKGAVCLSHGKLFGQDVVATEVVDTLGAGDAFSAVLTVEYLKGTDTRSSLELAAEFASEICQVEAAFGHGRPAISIPDANRQKQGNCD